jgi:hypothetical protein
MAFAAVLILVKVQTCLLLLQGSKHFLLHDTATTPWRATVAPTAPRGLWRTADLNCGIMGHRTGRTRLHQLVRTAEATEEALMRQAEPPMQLLETASPYST